MLTDLVWWWRTLSWFEVKRARLWQSVICVGVVAAVLGLIVCAL